RQGLEKIQKSVVEYSLRGVVDPKDQAALRLSAKADMKAGIMELGKLDGRDISQFHKYLPVISKIINDRKELRQIITGALPVDKPSLSDDMLSWAGRNLLRGKLAKDAWEYSNAAIRKNPRNEEAYATRSLASYYGKDYAAAQSDAAAALQLDPGDS